MYAWLYLFLCLCVGERLAPTDLGICKQLRGLLQKVLEEPVEELSPVVEVARGLRVEDVAQAADCAALRERDRAERQ